MQAEKSLVKLHDRSMPPPPPPGAKPPGLKLPASMGPPPSRQKHINPFLAAPLWEEAARSAPAPESALQNNSNFPEQGQSLLHILGTSIATTCCHCNAILYSSSLITKLHEQLGIVGRLQ